MREEMKEYAEAQMREARERRAVAEAARSVRIVSDILDERQRQDARWGEQAHPPERWQGILGEEMGEVCQATNDLVFGHTDNGVDEALAHLREELVQVAAVAAAWVEHIDRDGIRSLDCSGRRA